MSSLSHVLVVGSMNMDLVAHATQLPRLGETLSGQHFAQYHGGKGANQAVAARRLGAKVSLLACVGQDGFGDALIAGLQAEGVETRWVRRTEQAPTGIAMITVCQADNAIVVVPGANHCLSPDDIQAASAAFAEADVILAQLEVPLATIQAAAQLARQLNKPFLLNPAPAIRLPAELLDLVTLLTPNEHELAVALGHASDDWQAALAMLPGRALVTQGEHGACHITAAGELLHQPGFQVTAVDTTGAGDTFNGTLAALWSLGIPEAMRHANAAAALSVTQAGAQGGMPSWAALAAFLNKPA